MDEDAFRRLENITSGIELAAFTSPTNRYFTLLEENIKEEPYLWLWTHKRWKRTREGYARREAKRIEDRRKLVEKAKNNV